MNPPTGRHSSEGDGLEKLDAWLHEYTEEEEQEERDDTKLEWMLVVTVCAIGTMLIWLTLRLTGNI